MPSTTSRVVSRDLLLSEAFTLARQLAGHPAHLVRAVKEAIRRGMDMPLERALGLELHMAATATSAK